MSLKKDRLEHIIKVLEDKNLRKEINESNMEIFRKDIIPNIYEAQERFPRDKKSTDWQRFRKYTLPPSKWLLGVWSGATYSALIGSNGVSDRTVMVETTNTKNKITLKDSTYLNATLYLDESSKRILLENSKRIIKDKLQ
ncbi:MAG: hypothetical protein ACRC0A_01620 [Chitinophagaceae bacterium]